MATIGHGRVPAPDASAPIGRRDAARPGSVMAAAREAAEEVGVMRAAGRPVCDISHVLEAMRAAAQAAQDGSLQPAEEVAALSVGA